MESPLRSRYRSSRMRTVAALALLVVLGACASSGGGPGAGDQSAQLTVRLTKVEGPSYIEGFVPFLRVQQGGSTIIEQRMRSAGEGWTISTSLPAGAYL